MMKVYSQNSVDMVCKLRWRFRLIKTVRPGSIQSVPPLVLLILLASLIVTSPVLAETADDIVFALQTGMLPDGDFMGGSMGHVVEYCTSKLSDTDLLSIAEYLKSPGISENSGSISAISGSANDVTEKVSVATNGQGRMLGDPVRWLFWLFLAAGVVWLVSVLLRSKRPHIHKKDSG